MRNEEEKNSRGENEEISKHHINNHNIVNRIRNNNTNKLII